MEALGILLADKKAEGRKIAFILIDRIGHAVIKSLEVEVIQKKDKGIVFMKIISPSAIDGSIRIIPSKSMFSPGADLCRACKGHFDSGKYCVFGGCCSNSKCAAGYGTVPL